mmetsp:Transcript_2644/g.5707  ORF Transcript_2644/g.5707 Transcript_2644/m.5707 type:complete len:362 (+) Transcript_2644:241-1326(+)
MVENDGYSSTSSWNDIPMVPASLLPNDSDNFSFPSITYDSGDSRGTRNSQFEAVSAAAAAAVIEAENVGGPRATAPEPESFSSVIGSPRTSSSSSSSSASSSSSPTQFHTMEGVNNFLDTNDGCTTSHSFANRNDISTSSLSTATTLRRRSNRQPQQSPVVTPIQVYQIPGGSHNDRHQSNGINGGNNNDNGNNNDVTLAAGAAGCVIGFMTGGFFWILICGSVVAHSSTQVGMVGDVARALGDVAITARRNFNIVDDKHHIVEKTKRITTYVLSYLHQQVKKVEEHDPEMDAFLQLDGKSKMKSMLRWAWKKMGEFERQHNLLERGAIQLKALAITSYKMTVKIFTSLCQERHQQQQQQR